MDSDGAKARTLQAFLNNKNYKLNVMCDDDETKNVFIAVLILLFELNVCEIGSADFDEEFTKLINDLSFGNLNKSFDKTDEDLIELGNGEIGDGVFLRRLYLHNAFVKIKLTDNIVTVIGFFNPEIIPYDGRYMFS